MREIQLQRKVNVQYTISNNRTGIWIWHIAAWNIKTTIHTRH